MFALIFRKHFGSETVKIESSRKENRKSNPKWLTFQQFLSRYETEDIYMVQTLKDKMEGSAYINLYIGSCCFL